MFLRGKIRSSYGGDPTYLEREFERSAMKHDETYKEEFRKELRQLGATDFEKMKEGSGKKDEL